MLGIFYRLCLHTYYMPEEVHTCATDKRLKVLIKSIYAEEFQKREKMILVL